MDDTNVPTAPQADDQLYQQLLDYVMADVAMDRPPGFILSASFEHTPDCGKDRLPSSWILFLPDRKNALAVMESLGEYFKRPDLVFRILDEETQSKPKQVSIRVELRNGLKNACPCLRRIAEQAFEFAKIMGFITPASPTDLSGADEIDLKLIELHQKVEEEGGRLPSLQKIADVMKGKGYDLTTKEGVRRRLLSM